MTVLSYLLPLFSLTRRELKMENLFKCKKQQHDLAHSSSEVQAKLNFTAFLKLKAQSQVNAVTEKGKGCSRRGMRGGRQSSNRETCHSHCYNNSNNILFYQKLILKSYLQTFTRVNCKKWFVVCSDWLQYNYFTLFCSWTSSRNEFSLHLVNSEKKYQLGKLLVF